MTSTLMRIDPGRIRDLHDTLLDRHGPQRWWPGHSAFEVLAGAILVQRTRWENAARALEELDREGLLLPGRLAACPPGNVESLIRPAGFYRQKAARLRAAAAWWQGEGGLGRMAQMSTGDLRERLLGLDGIGPETADCILLYAFDRPLFIADAYARRLFARLGWIEPGGRGTYERLARAVNGTVHEGARFFNELHALIVTHGKSVCSDTPRCDGCPLRPRCPAGELHS